MEKINDITSNCPPPLISEENKLQNKIEEKKYYLNFEDNKYEFIIFLFENENNKEKIFYFKLINIERKNNDKNIYYESYKDINELIKLFLINISKCNDPIKKIFEKIEKFHSNNNVNIQKSNKTEVNILELIYTLKTLDNEDIEFKKELDEKEELIKEEKNESSLNEQIVYLRNSLQDMEKR